jgi:hypothetical protein
MLVTLFGYSMTLEYVYREFDEGLLQKIPEVAYEDDTDNIPSPPDVSNYLVSEVSLYNFFLYLNSQFQNVLLSSDYEYTYTIDHLAHICSFFIFVHN